MEARFPVKPHPVEGVFADSAWTADARCIGRGALFFEPFNERPSAKRRRVERAKRLCASCPVQALCRDAGRRNHESGIWGGETEEERAAAGYPPRAVVRRSVAAARSDRPESPDDPDHEAA